MSEAKLVGLDTVALLSYLTDQLGPQGKIIFEEAEEQKVVLFIPQIVIGELIYTISNEREIFGKSISKDLIPVIISMIHQTPTFSIGSLMLKGWNILLKLRINELHDRMIVATCLQENIRSIITLDKNIIDSNEITVIW